MLNDPLLINLLPVNFFETFTLPEEAETVQHALGAIGGHGAINFAATDLGDGQSTRKGVATGAIPTTLKISHSTSKENGPFTTDRLLVRFEQSKVNSTTGKPVTLSAYAVIALPQGGDFSEDEAVRLGGSLAVFLLQGGYQNGASPINRADPSIGYTLTRLMRGEA